MSDQHLGANYSATQTSADVLAGKGHSLRSQSRDKDGNEYLYVKASAAISQYDIVTIFGAGEAKPFSSAAVAGGAQAPLGYGNAADASIGAGEYGWVRVRGTGAVKVAASSTGTISGQLYACASANRGKVQTTASGGVKLTTLFAAATATTSTTASTVAVVFGYMMTSA
jgi:hypothetical protein